MVNLRNLKTTGTKPKASLASRLRLHVAEIDCTATWIEDGQGSLVQLGAVPIFVSKLFGGVSGQPGNHCCYAPDKLFCTFYCSTNQLASLNLHEVPYSELLCLGVRMRKQGIR